MTEVRAWTWPWLIATQAAKAVLAVVICLGLWGALPTVIGWQPTTVSSGSMLPRMRVGDIAVSRPVGTTPPTVDSVLLFDDPDHPGRLRMHRFVRVAEDGRLITRGDANTGDDSSPIALSAVRGIGTLLVPWVGLPVVWLRTGAWLPLGAALAGVIALTAVAGQSRRFGFPDPPQPDDAGPGDPPPDPAAGDAEQPAEAVVGPRPPPGPVRAAGALVVAVLLVLLPATPAGTAFYATSTARGSIGAAPWFSSRTW